MRHWPDTVEDMPSVGLLDVAVGPGREFNLKGYFCRFADFVTGRGGFADHRNILTCQLQYDTNPVSRDVSKAQFFDGGDGSNIF